jgi:hypothetical protein
LSCCTQQSLTLAGLVAGAGIFFDVSHVVYLWLEPDDWHLAVEFGLKKNEVS